MKTILALTVIAVGTLTGFAQNAVDPVTGKAVLLDPMKLPKTTAELNAYDAMLSQQEAAAKQAKDIAELKRQVEALKAAQAAK